MSQVILIEENQNLRDLLSINLKTYAGSEVIPRKNATEVIDLLTILPNIDLIITQPSVQGEETAKKILEFIITNNLEIGLIVNGHFEAEANENLIIIPDEKGWEEVVSTSVSVLGVTAEVLQKQILPEYIPIEVRYFLPLDTSCCDVFIRIKKSPTEYQFIKRIHSGDKFPKPLILKYLEQGLKYFYIPKDLRQNFTNFVSDHLSKKLDDENFSDLEEQIKLISQSYDIALNEITKLGFNSATIQLTDSIVNSMISSTRKSPEVNSVLHKIINSKSGYLYQHGHMSSVVSCEIAKNLGLVGEDIVKKFTYASFFKDISFIDKEDLAKITTFEELENAELSEEDWDLVLNHPLDGAVLIRKHPECPIDVDTIIKHHHGSQNGKGFSTINATKVPEIAKIFIIATEFVKELMSFKERGGKPTPIVDNLYKKYSTPDMILVIKALEKTLKAKAPKK